MKPQMESISTTVVSKMLLMSLRRLEISTINLKDLIGILDMSKDGEQLFKIDRPVKLEEEQKPSRDLHRDKHSNALLKISEELLKIMFMLPTFHQSGNTPRTILESMSTTQT